MAHSSAILVFQRSSLLGPKGGVGKRHCGATWRLRCQRWDGLIDADYGLNVPLMGSTQQPRVGEGNMIQPSDTHGIKTIGDRCFTRSSGNFCSR